MGATSIFAPGGRIVGAVPDMTYEPYGWKRDSSRYPVVWCPGAGGDYQMGPLEKAIVAELTCPWICKLHGATNRSWGSDASLDATTGVEASRAGAVTQLGAKSGKAILVAGSMGGLTAALYTIANPTKVAAAALFIPALDPQYVHDNDPGSPANHDAIETVYGGATVPNAKQAYLHGANWPSGVKLFLAYSTTDTFTPLASTQTFMNALPGGVLTAVSLGAVSHSYEGLVSSSAVLSFLGPYVT